MPTIHITVIDLPAGGVAVQTDLPHSPGRTQLSLAERFAIETLSLAQYSGFAVSSLPTDQPAAIKAPTA